MASVSALLEPAAPAQAAGQALAVQVLAFQAFAVRVADAALVSIAPVEAVTAAREAQVAFSRGHRACLDTPAAVPAVQARAHSFAEPHFPAFAVQALSALH